MVKKKNESTGIDSQNILQNKTRAADNLKKSNIINLYL
jgi:hypothetical protein